MNMQDKEQIVAKAQAAINQMTFLVSFLEKGNLLKVKKLPPRFDTPECKGVIEKMWQDLRGNLMHSVSDELVKEYRNADKSYIREATHEELIGCAVSKAKQYIEDLSKVLGLKKPQAKCKFTRAKDLSLIESFNLGFNGNINDEVRYTLSDFDRPYCTSSFEVREMMSGVGFFISMMETLTVVTPFKDYELFLEKYMSVDGYFTNGHPYDLLVHDVRDLRCAKEIKLVAIYAHPTRCSTRPLLEGESLGNSDKTLRVA